jgi:hypothetical protein
MDGYSAVNAGLLKELLIILAATVGFLSVVGAGVLSIVNFFRKKEPAVPQPVRVTKEPEFMTTEAHDVHRREVERRVVELEKRMNRVEDKMESDKQEIIEAIDAKIARVEDKVDAVPSRVIAILKDTKNLLGNGGKEWA